MNVLPISDGSYIDRGKPVRVLNIAGNVIMVSEVDDGVEEEAENKGEDKDQE